MPPGVRRRQLRHVAFPRPRLLSPRIAVEMRDDVDEFATSYGVVHDMAMRAHPHRAFRNGNVARHRASGRHPAPADTAGESRRVRAEQALSHNRMNAIGADDDVGLDRAAVRKAHRPAVIALFDAMQRAPRRKSTVLNAPRNTSSKSARCTVRLGAPNCWRNAPRRMREMTRPLFQLRMIRKSDSNPRAMIASSTPSTRRATSALGLRLRPAPISFNAGDCSQTITSAPRRSSARAAARPPTPPPTTAMRGVRITRVPLFADLNVRDRPMRIYLW